MTALPLAAQAASPAEIAHETDRFRLRYAFHPRRGRMIFVVESKGDGRHRAEHVSVNLIEDDGNVSDVVPIDDGIARFIIRHFDQRGDTESFSIYRSDLAAGHMLPRDRRPASPAAVRHSLTRAEQSFTATGAKLAHHQPIFAKYRDTGFGSIIRATLTNHQVCSSKCQFCSTIARNRRDMVSLAEAQRFVEKLYVDQADFNRRHFARYNDDYRARTGTDIRLRGLILSGGGQPNLWPHFQDFTEWMGGLDVDMGLITNGFPPKIDERVYDRFTWVRISITPEDASPFYPGGRFDRQYLPANLIRNPAITVGYSYVYGPWTTDDMLLRIRDSIDENGFDYCRLLTDCNLTRDAQIRAHQALSERLFRLGMIDAAGKPLGRVFHQLKYHGTPEEARELWDLGQCYLQTYNVFWDTTGHEKNGKSYCYPCDSVTVLAEEATDGTVLSSERRFNPEKWGTVPNTEVERLFTEPVHPFFDPRDACTSCLFMRNNRTVKELTSLPENGVPPASPELEHVNFP
jgi:hypothetical protein